VYLSEAAIVEMVVVLPSVAVIFIVAEDRSYPLKYLGVSK
jgi:hypothetical protein